MFTLIHTYWVTLKKSASDPSYYTHILGAPFWPSFWFLATTIALITTTSLLYFRIVDFPKFISSAKTETAQVLSQFPEKGKLSLQDGKLIADGVSQSLTLTSSEKLQNLGFPRNLVAVLPNATSSASFVELLENTIAINFGMLDTSLTDEVFKYGDIVPDSVTVITKETVTEVTSNILSAMPSLATIGCFVLFPILWLVIMVSTLTTLVFCTIVTQVLAWVVGVRLTFKKSYQLGLHSIAVVSIIEHIRILALPQSSFSILIMGFFGMMMFVIWELLSLKGKRYG